MNTPTQQVDKDASLISRLFNAGAHFGFSKSRRHPTAAPYLFGNKQGTDVFDLEKTSLLLTEAVDFLEGIGKQGKNIILVGTKEEIKTLVKNEAASIEMPYVTNRWIGGMLTNFSEIQRRIRRLGELKEKRESGELERKFTKKERVMLSREMDKLEFNFGSISTLERMPAAMVVVDPRHDSIAVSEARQMGIPIVAIMGSDCNASDITKPVFVNDAHRASVVLALETLMEGFKKGVAAHIPAQPKKEVAV